MELFGFKVKFADEDKSKVVAPDQPGVFPRLNFNDFHNGFTTIFVIMIGEDWNSPMYDHQRAMGWGYVLFFIGWFIIGNVILLNMFLAILLENFSEPLDAGADEDEDDLKPKSAAIDI